METPVISTLSTILKRPIEPRSDALIQRRELAAELQENCQKLAIYLKGAFRKQAKQVNEVDSGALEKKVMNLMNDFQHVDSTFQEDTSPILQYLAIDMRFKDLAQSSADFYKLALDLKKLLNENVPDSAALENLCKEDGLSKMTSAWQSKLDTMLNTVNQEYMKVMALQFSW